jgi:hypothetical protein
MRKMLSAQGLVAALLGVAGLAAGASAQCAANGGNYVITQTSGGSIVPGTTDTGNHTDDSPETLITLPFTWSFYGTAYTQALLGSNGDMTLGSTSGSTAFGNTCLPATAFAGPTMMPYWDDLRTDAAGSGIFTSTTGVAPNRIFNIEWRATYYTGGQTLNFEVRLYENSTRFDFVYGSTSGLGGSGGTLGCQQAGAAGSRNTQFVCNTATNDFPAAGTVLSFDCAVTSAPSCNLSLSPGTVATGDTILAQATIIPGTPASPPYTVSVDASQVNAGTVQLYDDGPAGGHGDLVAGDLIFTNNIPVGAGTTNGLKTLTSTVTDSAVPTPQSSTCSGTVTVNTVALAGAGAVAPNSVLPNNPVLFTVAVTPATGPASTGIAAALDLSGLGGAANTQMYDDGTHGDVTAGDHTFSLAYTVPSGTPLSNYNVPFSVSDLQGRSASGTIALSVGYCAVSTLNNAICTTTYEFLSNVTIGSINDTELCSTPSYQDQTSMTTNGAPGDSVPVSITIGSYWGADYVTIFTDWDNNGNLADSGEATVVTAGGGTGSGAGSQTFTSTLNVPAGATTGAHRMRVWLTYSIVPTPCLTGQTFGQIKDYTFVVGGSTGSCCTVNQCHITTQADCATAGGTWTAGGTCPAACGPHCGSADFNCDGDTGTDSDIEAFFACLAGNCPPLPCISSADFNGDGDTGTDSDIEAFFRVLAGGSC